MAMYENAYSCTFLSILTHLFVPAAVLLTIGGSLAYTGSTLAGKIVCSVAVVPLVLWIVQAIDDYRFARIEQALDETSPLIKV